MAAAATAAAGAKSAFLFDDIFSVLTVNPDGKKFDKGTALLTHRARCVVGLG